MSTSPSRRQRAYTMPVPSNEPLIETPVLFKPPRKPKCTPGSEVPPQTSIDAPFRPFLNITANSRTVRPGVLPQTPPQVLQEDNPHQPTHKPEEKREECDGDKRHRPASQCSSEEDEPRSKRQRLSRKQPQSRGRSPLRPVIRPMRRDSAPSTAQVENAEGKSRSVRFVEPSADTSECECW